MGSHPSLTAPVLPQTFYPALPASHPMFNHFCIGSFKVLPLFQKRAVEELRPGFAFGNTWFPVQPLKLEVVDLGTEPTVLTTHKG